MVARPRRPALIGSVQLAFYVKSALERTPLTALHGLPAPLAVSSPEATVFDLVAFSHRIGGIERAGEVIRGLEGALSPTGLHSAIGAGVSVAVLQRTGHLFERLGFARLAEIVWRALPAHLQPVLLQSHGRRATGRPDGRWAIVDNLNKGTVRT